MIAGMDTGIEDHDDPAAFFMKLAVSSRGP